MCCAYAQKGGGSGTKQLKKTAAAPVKQAKKAISNPIKKAVPKKASDYDGMVKYSQA